MALPRANPQRIVMFGDTGCRLLTGDPGSKDIWQAQKCVADAQLRSERN